MKMKIPVRRSCMTLIVLSALVEAIRANENENSTADNRQSRVNGRIVKLYSGYKPDPVLCTEEGFKADPVVCSAFYRCTKSSSGKFTVFKFQCGPGTVYDPEIEVCNHPSSTKRAECGGMKLHDNQNAEIENEIEQHELPSPISTIVPVYSSHANIVTSYTTHKVPSPSSSDEFKPTENGYINLFATSSNPHQVGTTSGTVEEFNHNLVNYSWTDYKNATKDKIVSVLEKSQPCASDGFIGDSENCKKFYRCVSNLRGGFIRYEFACSEPTVWDDNLQSCNHPWAVRSRRCGRAGNNNVNYVESLDPSTNNEKSTERSDQYNSYLNQISENYGDRINNEGEKYKPDRNQINYESQFSQPTMSKEDTNIGTEANSLSKNTDSVFINQVNQEKELFTSTTDSNKSTNQVNLSEKDDNNNVYGFQEHATQSKPEIYLLKTTLAPFKILKNDCVSTGFIGDNNDCKKFYRCVDNGRGGFIKYEFSCGEGTVWDPEIEGCNHAWAVKHCGRSIAPVDTTSSSIPHNSYSTTNTYDSSFTVAMTSIQTLTSQKDNNDYDLGYGQQLSESTHKPDIHFETTTSKHIHDQKNSCQESGFIGEINDCKKFYRCVDNGNGGFIRHEFSCGEGTLWDPEIQACNHAWAVKNCGNNMPSKESIFTSSTSNVNVINSDNEYIQQNYTENENTTPNTNLQSISTSNFDDKKDCTGDEFMGDKNDCQKFYRCVNDGNGTYIKYAFSCGDGTFWDSQINACNHESLVKDCGSNPTESNTNTSTKPPSNSNSEESSDDNALPEYNNNGNEANPTTSTTVSQTVTNTGSECESSGFMGDSKDCQKFYRCVDNGNGGFIRHEFMCGEGTVWDRKIEACNHRWAVEECGGTTHFHEGDKTTKTTLPSKSPETETQGTYTHSDPYSSTSTSNIPTTSVIVTTTQPSHEDNRCSSEGFFANHNDCTKFYRCVSEGNDVYTKYEFSCAEGTAWDLNTQSCNYINKVEACGSNLHSNTTDKPVYDEQAIESDTTKTTSTSSSITTTASTTAPTTTSTAMSTTTLTTSTSKSTTENAKPAEQSTCQEEGYFGDTQDCKKFYRCVYESDGKYTKYDFTCAEGTIWDQDVITCNHPRDVKNLSCTSESQSTSSPSVSTSPGSNNETAITSKPLTTTSKPSSTSTRKPASTTTDKPSSSTSEIASNKNETNSNCTTENPNSKNFTCTKAGFYSDPHNCKKFYRCVDWENNAQKFSIYHFQCADGTIWDPALETCNHEESVYPPRNCNGTQQENETSPTTASTTTQSITTEKTTTQSSTSKKPTTTEQSTTQSSTTEGTTVQSSTTEESTTQSSTTEESTTKSSTTDESTTKSSTTEESTTQSSTTQSSTTQSSTTGESTTQVSTTEESTTQSSTTEETTTQSLTTQSSTTEESTTQSSTTQSSTTGESTTQVSTTEESTTHSSTTEESTSQSSTQESTTHSSTPSTDLTSNTEQSTTTTEISTSTTENNQESTTETPTNKECPNTSKDQNLYVCPTSFKRHPKYCNLFYQCTDDNDNHEPKIAVFHCPNNTIYDESKIQCVEEKKSSKKCNGQISQRHRVKRLGASLNEPYIVTKERMACTKSGHLPFEKDTSCSPAFLKCELSKSGELRGFVYRCPENFVYWNISRRCEPFRKVKDCKRSTYPWKTRYDIPLETINIAS